MVDPAPLVIDIGPNTLALALALISALAAISAAWIARGNGIKIDSGNSELANRLALIAQNRAAAEALHTDATKLSEKGP